jgi:acetyltransferase-like isoleucine patch superfamily enzyme
MNIPSVINRLDLAAMRLPEPLINNKIRTNILRRHGAKIGDDTCISGQSKIPNPATLEIGNDSVICAHALIDGWELTKIGNHVIIGNGSTLLTGNHDIHSPQFVGKLLPIVIEDYVWVATNAIVLGGVTLGYGCVVGAGAVVREDVPPLAVVIGNPGKIVTYRKCSEFDHYPGKYLLGTLG